MLSFMFAPSFIPFNTTLHAAAEYAKNAVLLEKRLAWQAHFPNLLHLGLSVCISAPSPWVYDRHFSRFGRSGHISFDRYLPSPHREYACHAPQIELAVQAMMYRPAGIKARKYRVRVRCEGCRRCRWGTAQAALDPEWLCKCEERFEEVFRGLLEGDEGNGKRQMTLVHR